MEVAESCFYAVDFFLLNFGVDEYLLEFVLRGDEGYAVFADGVVEVADVGGGDFDVLCDFLLHSLCDELCADGLCLVSADLLEWFFEVFFEFVLASYLLCEVVESGVDLLHDFGVFDFDAV